VKIGRKGEHPVSAQLRLAKQHLWSAVAKTLQLRGFTEREARQAVAHMKKNPPRR